MAVRRAAEQQTRRLHLLRPAGASGLVGPQAAPCPVAGFMELVVVTFVFSFQQLLGYQRAQWSLVGYTNANFNFYRSK